MNITAPIIVIGAGRSGSTLLTGILSRHPEISMFGETNFLAPHLWNVVLQDLRFGSLMTWPAPTLAIRDGKRRPQQRLDLTWDNPSEWSKFYGMDITPYWENERSRIAEILAEKIMKLIKIDETRKHWGFKEIWNGSGTNRYDWKIYDTIFPNAVWVHLIRNPFEFAASNAAWNAVPFTYSFMIERLKDWVSMVRYSKLRQQTGRYFEIRYEDLVTDPQKTLSPLFDFLNIDWSVECSKAMEIKQVPSNRNRDQEMEVFKSQAVEVAGLYNLAEEFGYLEDIKNTGINLINDNVIFAENEYAEETFLHDNNTSSIEDNLTAFLKNMPAIDFVLPREHIFHEEGYCYIYPFRTMAAKMFSYLPVYNHLILYEDGNPLPLGNALHEEIRRAGKGRYSMWYEQIYFSTSDNSDPRTNGRTYSVRVPSYIYVLENLPEEQIRGVNL